LIRAEEQVRRGRVEALGLAAIPEEPPDDDFPEAEWADCPELAQNDRELPMADCPVAVHRDHSARDGSRARNGFPGLQAVVSAIQAPVHYRDADCHLEHSTRGRAGRVCPTADAELRGFRGYFLGRLACRD
jgi:hypothetical protein